MTGVETDATSAISESIHLVGPSPVFLKRIQASGLTSGGGRAANADIRGPLARRIGPNLRKRHKGQWAMQTEREHEATKSGPANEDEEKQDQVQGS